MRYCSFLFGLGLLLNGSAGFTQKTDKPADPPKEMEPDTTQDDIKTLKAVPLVVEGPALLDYFRERTFKEADPKKIEVLIAGLGDDDFATREKSYLQLFRMGPSALVAIKEAAGKHPDLQGRKRGLDLKGRIEAKQEPAIQTAAARMVARLKPASAAEVMLNYLPFADPSTVDEFCKAIAAVAMQQGKVEPAVVSALTDKVAIKRAAAAEAILRVKAADQKEAARVLLKDTEPPVRLRVALALVPDKDKEIVPVLVELLQHLSSDQMWAAEEVLLKLAGDDAPAVSLGTNEATRKACHAAWAAWLKKNDKLDLARLDQPTPLLNLTVIAQQQNRFVGGRVPMGMVMEIDRDKKVKWKFDVPNNPVFAQVVGRERVLVCEYNSVRVTERDFKGNIHWEVNVESNPIAAQRLPNGNTLVVMQHLLVEFNPKKERVHTYQRNNGDIFRAKKLRNGEIVLITNAGNLVRIDSKNNQEIRAFSVGGQTNLFGNFDVLPNGNFLVPVPQNNKISEFNGEGKEVNKWEAQQANAVVRLPNGNMLVTSVNQRRVFELDRTGREVWAHATDGSPFNATKR